MTELQVNIFPIVNLDELVSMYRLYRIRGLHRNQPEYYQNRQTLIRKLSYKLRSPVTIIDRDGDPHLVVRADSPTPPSPFTLVRTSVYLDACPDSFTLDYTHRSPENDEICLRFLQFMLQHPLSTSPSLWQPGAGKPFFLKQPAEQRNGIDRYTGFAVRAVITSDGGMGLCVDLSTKFVSTRPLSAKMTREQFRRFKGSHCIYRFGHQWFDVQVSELSDLTASETLIPLDGTQMPLSDYIVTKFQKPIPTDLAELPHDCSVLVYNTNQRESRAAPTAMCYRVLDTQSHEVQRNHGKSVPPPHIRYKSISAFVRDHLKEIRFGGTLLRVSTTPMPMKRRMLSVPDLKFGNEQVLSVKGAPDTIHTSLDHLGRQRSSLLRDTSAGFFVTDPLQRQYLLLPQSIADSVGERYRHDLANAVDRMFPQENGYDPIVLTYNDRGPRTFLDQGEAILEIARDKCLKPGYALVMVHDTDDRRIRQHDQLAAMVIREMRNLDVVAAVNHSTMARECYELVHSGNGTPRYEAKRSMKGKLAGYLRNVALNKVLLTNERWPFVLATPLHADITIGIDVKQNTAGFTVVAAAGRIIRTECFESGQREKLLAGQIRKYLVELVTAERDSLQRSVRHIVIHRDGRIFDTELEGVRQAIEELRNNGIVEVDATMAVLEIPKSSLAPVRIFDVESRVRRGCWVENPQVGTYHIVGDDEAYICTTGRAFPRHGTVRPLHVKYVAPGLPFGQCLEDLYALTVLAWTRPEDCTRHPITIKLTDRRLGDDASEYDTDALEFDTPTPLAQGATP